MSRAPNASVPSLSSRVGSWWRRLGQSAAVAVGMALAALATHAASANTCPADFDGNEQVDGADLGTMLAGWGQPGITDLDGNGTTDGADLGALLAAWGACPKPSPTTFVGVVVLADGTPVADAVVVTDLGGTAATGKGGGYELSLMLDKPVGSATISAVASIGGTTYQGSAEVGKVALGELNEVDPIVVAAKGEGCSGGFGWLPGFSTGEMSSTVFDLTVFDDGTGPALYAGGSFSSAGGVAANCIAKWDGTAWSPLGSGVSGFPSVFALTVFDDGTGPALYAGGKFTIAGGVEADNIARWDGSAWSALGSGMSGEPFVTSVSALTVFDDGTGPALYAGGRFTSAGGIDANNIARWDGTAWSALGQGIDGDGTVAFVSALTVFDDGTGPALYAGGRFTIAGGIEANRIARWDGTAWSALGSGVAGGISSFPSVSALTVFDDGTGPALYAGGNFATAGGVEANNIARWDGTAWGGLGSGVAGGNSSFPSVYDLTVFDDGTGPALYAGGNFSTAGGVSARYIARWDGTAWSPLGSGADPTVRAMTVFDDGTGPVLYAGVGSRIDRWEGTAWSPLGSGLSGYAGISLALAVFDDGTGPALYAGGTFAGAGGVAVENIARWNGTAWSPLGNGVDVYDGGSARVYALTVFDDGTGPALYAGGRFERAGATIVNHIAKWDGTAWSALGQGIDGYDGLYIEVYALTVFDDGTGPALYAGGRFTIAGGIEANYFAKWDGTSWSPVGSGVNGTVFALTVFDDGTGPALYAGGGFTTAGGVSANFIAKWNGTAWSPLGSGMNNADGYFGKWVRALTIFDDGTGPALYAGGEFTTAGGVSANFIAKWNGTAWSALGSGMNDKVYALTVFDDGTGPALYAGGWFTTAGGPSANRIAKWNGTAWIALGSGVSGPSSPTGVSALTVFDDGTGPALYAGGNFTTAGGVSSSRIAKWGCVD